MLLLDANHIEKYYGDRLIFGLESLKIYNQDRIGIVGLNGAGKTTLLRILAGEDKPDKGTIRWNGKIAVIDQFGQEGIDVASNQVKTSWNVNDRDVETMSGGEITRLKIANALEQKADMIFADEPTSHLDLEGIEQVERSLKSYSGAVILISHDRELLDAVCMKIVEIENGKVHEYVGNYSVYREQKELEIERAHFEYEQYSKEKKRLEQSALEKSQKAVGITDRPRGMSDSEYKNAKWSKNAKQLKMASKAKAIEKRIAQMDKKEKPREQELVKFDLAYHTPLHSKVAIQLENASKAFGSRTLFTNASGSIKPGMKVALFGSNGCGKSTLLKMILSGEPGTRVSSACKIGYFNQNLSLLDETKTILQNVMEDSSYPEVMIRTVLARLLFKREDVYKPVGVLSGGERVKVSLAKVFLGNYNVLLLDEPTNYLDLFTQEEIQEVLRSYPGTILIATHDRRMMNELADHVLVFDSGVVTFFSGNYREYTAKRDEPVESRNEEETLMRLEIELSDIVGRLSVPKKEDIKEELERRYLELIKEIKNLKNKAM